jgi:hypothetical protein
MLRITVTDTPSEQQWTLQGRLTGPWVDQLQSCWMNSHAAREARACVVDVTDLTAVDQKGEEVLRAMVREGAKFHACGVYITHMLRGLVRECRRSTH